MDLENGGARPVTLARIIVSGTIAGAAIAMASASAHAELRLPPRHYEYTPAAVCPVPTFAYKGCEDQVASLEAAILEAKAQNKLLIVVFGADWCPWCRALDIMIPSDQIMGYKGDGLDYRVRFNFTKIAVSVIAKPRNAPVPSGIRLIDEVAAEAGITKPPGIPFIAVINPETGKVFARNTEDLENNTATAQGHHAEKIRAVLREAEKAVR
jgi:thiol-disulfide isomerase/thioredoxin